MSHKKLIIISLITIIVVSLFVGFDALATGNSNKPPNECMTDEFRAGREKGGFFQYVSDDCFYCGNCSLCDMISSFVAVANIILMSMGGIAVIAFMWGTFGLVMAQGKPEQIQASRKVIRGTIVGIVIVLIAWQFVSVFIFVLLRTTAEAQKGDKPALELTKTWFQAGEFCK